MPTTRGHHHAEAFMVMRYEGAGGRREWIWNSRDGITPFVVHSADGKGVEMPHVLVVTETLHEMFKARAAAAAAR